MFKESIKYLRKKARLGVKILHFVSGAPISNSKKQSIASHKAAKITELDRIKKLFYSVLLFLVCSVA